MTDLNVREQEIEEIFEWIEDDTDRYVEIIEFGKSLDEFDEKYRNELYEVKGCQSKVWLYHEFTDGELHFYADSNTAITKGIVAILIHLWSGLPPEDIANAKLTILDKIELRNHLTSQRNNGLTAMIKQMKATAKTLAEQNK